MGRPERNRRNQIGPCAWEAPMTDAVVYRVVLDITDAPHRAQGPRRLAVQILELLPAHGIHVSGIHVGYPRRGTQPATGLVNDGVKIDPAAGEVTP